MPTLRKRNREVEPPSKHQQPTNDDQTQTTETQKVSLQYEQSREQRIKENRERLQKLGIVDLSHELKYRMTQRRTLRNPSDRKTPQLLSSAQPSEPVRRSSRLQKVGPVSYVEERPKKSKAFKDNYIRIEEGSRPEDGKRIYDSSNGKTCHQCRQKTLGHHTQCCKCNMVQGQFCGDCLYMRYGEHVLEALENPNWTCPVCRGICNCSLCRQAKGWCPTGTLYRRISAMGYKSVAHYLIQTRRSEVGKDSLPYSDMEKVSKEFEMEKISTYQSGHLGSLEGGDNKQNEMQSQNLGSSKQVSARRLLPFCEMEGQSERIGFSEASHVVNNQLRSSNPQPVDKEFDIEKIHVEDNKQFDGRLRHSCGNCNGHVNELQGVNEKGAVKIIVSEEKAEKTKEGLHMENNYGNNRSGPETSAKLNKDALSSETSTDSIAGRLRRSRMLEKGCDKLQRVNGETSVFKHSANVSLSEKEKEKVKEIHYAGSQNGNSSIPMEKSSGSQSQAAYDGEINQGSINGRLRKSSRLGKVLDNDDDLLELSETRSDIMHSGSHSPGKRTKVTMKPPTSSSKLSSESIAGRLRPRHKTT
ncbi:Zinc-finger domain of monoamine-oxidase A repressor R1 [Quillaja saponaria]|uniref:Zinc-finger domain of monoamine-oxidase A repressor R1 n=1 Tax=Quillaja saponaria TaxID=32244 RepID=A0AAD7KRE7_QUISA|nr:Zinc-finger domain of monoamine-oxidase A repressor R1 [Quillaja saponaria]